jgi:signal transduction histidine kinase
MSVSPEPGTVVSRVAAFATIIFAISVPIFYFALSYQHIVRILATEAEINARLADSIVNSHPELWRFQLDKLGEFQKRRPGNGYTESLKVVDHWGNVIVHSSADLAAPLITRSADIFDWGVPVARIEINRSLWPLVIQTVFVAFVSLVIAGFAFFSVKLGLRRFLEHAVADNTRLLEANARNLERFQILYEIQSATASTLDVTALRENLMDKASRILPYAACTLRLVNPQTFRLERVGSYNIDESVWARAGYNPQHRLGKEVVRLKRPIVVLDSKSDPLATGDDFLHSNGFRSFLGLPLVAGGEVLGVLAFFTKFVHPFNKEEVDLLSTMAGQVAIAIYNARLYEETKTQAIELANANKLQAGFASMIAHDFRAPLSAIVSAAEMMEDGTFGRVSRGQKKWLKTIGAHGRAVAELVNEFLDLSKLEAGYITLECLELNLDVVIANTIDNYLPLGLRKGLVLKKQVDPALGPVYGDPRRLSQVFSNLVSNAIKSTPKGGEILIGAYANGASGAIVYVKDTGMGLTSEEIDGIFEKYRQTNSRNTSSFNGNGLGLAISKMIVLAHGGSIWVNSEYGKGATFYFSLPYPSERNQRDHSLSTLTA